MRFTFQIKRFPRLLPLPVLMAIWLLSSSTVIFAATEKEASLEQYISRHCASLPFSLLEQHNYQIVPVPGSRIVARLYAQNGNRPLWLHRQPSHKVRQLLDVLATAPHHGLQSSSYYLPQLSADWQSTEVEKQARFDVLLTAGLLRYAFDLSFGHIALFQADPKNFTELADLHFQPAAVIKSIQESEDVQRYFKNLAPDHFFYTALQQELKQIRQHTPPQKAGPTTGKARHTASRKTSSSGDNYQQKIDVLRVNLARWRWVQHDLGQRFTLVNIAGATLENWAHGKKQSGCAVIVGKKENQTPLTTGYIRQLEFHPYWNIPPEIAQKEQLQKLRANPRHLVEKKVRLFSSWDENARELNSTRINWHQVSPEAMARYRLRQDPGPHNSLGRIKFIFPNPWSVYLHDTPGKMLFGEADRSLSHGCIRVADPVGLAVFVLNNQDQQSSIANIRALLHKSDGKPHTVDVRQPLAIHLTYQTAWLDRQGKLQIAADIYGQDQAILAAMRTQ